MWKCWWWKLVARESGVMRRKIRKGKMRLLLAVTFEFLAILAQISLFFFWLMLFVSVLPNSWLFGLVWFGGVSFVSFRFCALIPENNVTCINNWLFTKCAMAAANKQRHQEQKQQARGGSGNEIWRNGKNGELVNAKMAAAILYLKAVERKRDSSSKVP